MSDSIDRLWSRSQRYIAESNLVAARAALEALTLRQPTHAAANLMLSCLAWESGQLREAGARALAAAQALPDDAGLRLDVCRALLDAGETVAAIAALRHPLLTESTHPSVLLNTASLMRSLGEHDVAFALVDRAGQCGAQGVEFLYFRGSLCTIHGQFDEALRSLDACLRLDPQHAQAALDRSSLRKQSPRSQHLDSLGQSLVQTADGSLDRALFQLARFKELDDLDRPDEAWRALADGNAICADLWRYDAQEYREWIACVKRICTTGFLRQRSDALQSGPQPIFIFGLPRSGTTLLDRLLGAHPRVRSVGELDDFPAQVRWAADARETLGARVRDRLAQLDYEEIGRRYLRQTQWRAQGAGFFIDKRPWNQFMVGLIRCALPGAKLLRMVREPMATAYSNFRTYLGPSFPYSYSFNALSDYMRQCKSLHEVWHAVMPGQMLDVSYADLVTDTEATMRTVLAFCGLEWSNACMDTRANPSAIATPSALRARGVVDQRGLGEWRRYATQLEPLRRDWDAQG